MNYKKIYSDFIADRRNKTVSGYYEKHHIIPKALGGEDNEDNLITLSASDHLFAHLLLAKIHGGSMWVAVYYSMKGNDKQNKNITNRKIRTACNIAKKRKSEYMSSIMSGRIYTEEMRKNLGDKKIYTFFNEKYGEVKGTRDEISKRLQLKRTNIDSLVRGETLCTKSKWFCLEGNPSKKSPYEVSSERMRGDKNPCKLKKNREATSKRTLRLMKNKEYRDRILKTTKTPEAIEKRKETLKSSKKWAAYLKRKPEINKKTCRRGPDHPNYNHTIYNWIHKESGLRESATKWTMQNIYGGYSTAWNKVTKGNVYSHLGWMINSN